MPRHGVVLGSNGWSSSSVMLGIDQRAFGAERSPQRGNQPTRPTLDRRHLRKRRVHDQHAAGNDAQRLKLLDQIAAHNGHTSSVMNCQSGVLQHIPVASGYPRRPSSSASGACPPRNRRRRCKVSCSTSRSFRCTGRPRPARAHTPRRCRLRSTDTRCRHTAGRTRAPRCSRRMRSPPPPAPDPSKSDRRIADDITARPRHRQAQRSRRGSPSSAAARS